MFFSVKSLEYLKGFGVAAFKRHHTPVVDFVFVEEEPF